MIHETSQEPKQGKTFFDYVTDNIGTRLMNLCVNALSSYFQFHFLTNLSLEGEQRLYG